MRALVTGAAGFIGSAITRRLLNEGWSVVGIDALTDYYDVELKRNNLRSIPATGFQFVEADLLSADLGLLLDGIDVVFHQAGQPGVRKSWGSDFAIYTSANIEATQRLLEVAKSAPTLQRLVYASSSSVYGNAARFPVRESDLPRPLSPYGVSKLAAEHLCSLYAENFGVPTVSLRYFTVYGPGQRPDMAFTRFVKAAILNEPITIYGTGEQIRDFTFIDDIVNANYLAATVETGRGRVFNVAGGSSISVNDALDLLESISNCPLDVRHIAGVAGDVARTGGSTMEFRTAVGWEPRVKIEDGLRAQFDWGVGAFPTSPEVRLSQEAASPDESAGKQTK